MCYRCAEIPAGQETAKEQGGEGINGPEALLDRFLFRVHVSMNVCSS